LTFVKKVRSPTRRAGRLTYISGDVPGIVGIEMVLLPPTRQGGR